MKTIVPKKVLKEMTDIFDELLDSLSTLHSLSTIHLPILSEQELFRHIMETLIEHYSFDKCSIFLYEKNALYEAGSLTWKEWEGGPVPLSSLKSGTEDGIFLETMMAMAVQTGEPQICDDCIQDNHYTLLAQGKKPTAVGSIMCSPIAFRQKIIGLINVSYPMPGQLNEWQKRLIPVFCRFLGQIITTNRLLNDLEKEVNSRTRQLDGLLAETRRMEQHYQELAMIDDLTDLYNRRFFFNETRRILGRTMRHFRPFSLLVIDLDRFKLVNDSYGHSMGDTVLQDVAKAMKLVLRDTDIVARTGGEEFAVALSETDKRGSRELSERLLSGISSLSWVVDGVSFKITASIGISSLSSKIMSVGNEVNERSGGAARSFQANLADLMDDLYSKADTAMYVAKRRGGNQVAQLPDDV